MSDNETVAAPDYSPVMAAFNEISKYAGDRGQEAYKWAKDMVAKNTDLTNLVNTGLVGIGGAFDDAARDSLAAGKATRDEAVGYLQDQRDRYTDPARKAMDMGAAGAQAAQATEAARDASTRELESYGVNPASTRFAALDIPARLQSAAIRVGAENIAGRQGEVMADNANQQLLAQGNVDTGQAAQQAGVSTGARTGAVNTALGNTASGYAGLGTDLAWTGAKTGAVSGSGNTLNQQFSNQAQAAKQNSSTSSGIGSLLGLGASMLGSGGAFGAGGALAFLEEGGSVDDINGGGAVPAEMSPSGGAAVDDIPAVSPNGPAMLNAGEFVIPQDVVRWKGEEWLQKLIMSARKAMDGAPAKPEQQGAVPA